MILLLKSAVSGFAFSFLVIGICFFLVIGGEVIGAIRKEAENARTKSTFHPVNETPSHFELTMKKVLRNPHPSTSVPYSTIIGGMSGAVFCFFLASAFELLDAPVFFTALFVLLVICGVLLGGFFNWLIVGCVYAVGYAAFPDEIPWEMVGDYLD